MRWEPRGAGSLRTPSAAGQATSEKKKNKAPTSGNVSTWKSQRKKGGIASRQGTSSSLLFMGMFLVPSFKLWLELVVGVGGS